MGDTFGDSNDVQNFKKYIHQTFFKNKNISVICFLNPSYSNVAITCDMVRHQIINTYKIHWRKTSLLCFMQRCWNSLMNFFIFPQQHISKIFMNTFLKLVCCDFFLFISQHERRPKIFWGCRARRNTSTSVQNVKGSIGVTRNTNYICIYLAI